MNYKYITYIDFKDFKLDFSENYFNTIRFRYKEKDYIWQIVKKTDGTLRVYEKGLCNQTIVGNKVLQHMDFDFIFKNQSQVDVALNQENLFTTFCLGVLSNEL
jgi:hypothetical protein